MLKVMENKLESQTKSAEEWLTEQYHKMEESTTRKQIEALEGIKPHPPMPPYKPRHDEPVTETAEDRLVKIWHEMEETTTRHQIEAIAAAPRHPPMPPYKPR